MNSPLTPTEALQVLGLWNPSLGTKPNTHYLKLLVDRGLLSRIALGPQTFRYDREDCEQLLSRVKNEGILLTIKP